jgi:hypothetical protein
MKSIVGPSGRHRRSLMARITAAVEQPHFSLLITRESVVSLHSINNRFDDAVQSNLVAPSNLPLRRLSSRNKRQQPSPLTHRADPREYCHVHGISKAEDHRAILSRPSYSKEWIVLVRYPSLTKAARYGGSSLPLSTIAYLK